MEVGVVVGGDSGVAVVAVAAAVGVYRPKGALGEAAEAAA